MINGLVENIIRNAPLSIDDNYKLRLSKRAKMITKRRERLIDASMPGQIKYDTGGAATRMFINTKYSRSQILRMKKLIGDINRELNQIGKYL